MYTNTYIYLLLHFVACFQSTEIYSFTKVVFFAILYFVSFESLDRMRLYFKVFIDNA